MSDLTARITEILAAHRFWWANHASIGSDAHCGCGDRPRDMDEWNVHVAALIAEAAQEHYRPVIETSEDVNALPAGTVVRCGFGVVRELRGPRGREAWTGSGDFGLPAVVLWSPGAGE